MKLLLLVDVTLSIIARSEPQIPTCKYPVYCNSLLLHYVQKARIFPDSKTFVDYQLRNDANVTLAAFQELLNQTNNSPTKSNLIQFVHQHFTNDNELENWVPPDFLRFPPFFETINDRAFRTLAEGVRKMWPLLGKKIKNDVYWNQERYSIIPVSNGFIVPGGRYREIHYWDTYWIIKGLLICGMQSTAQGMIENLVELLRTVGHVPSGGRWYYQERSQPPLLTAMVSLYFQYFPDIKLLKKVIGALEEELNYWLNTKSASFSKNDKTYTLLRYYAPSAGPRPESYFEDYGYSLNPGIRDRENFFTELKSAAESGWDFSSRWFIDANGDNAGPLLNTRIDAIIPVDLNAIFASALQNVSNYQKFLLNDTSAEHWESLAMQWRSNIEEVFWNEDAGIWLDYDIINQKHRNYFYPSNLAPLWMEVLEKEDIAKRAPRVIQYLHNVGALKYRGGIPSSLFHTGEQWDLPNVWPPLVSLFVNSVDALDTEESKNISFNIAQDFLQASLYSYLTNDQKIFDRYNADPHHSGIGGEHSVQEGFGWTIGVILELIAKYNHQNISSNSSNLPNFDYEAQEPQETQEFEGSLVMV